MIEKIIPCISQEPFLIQVAKDQQWEETWNIPLSTEFSKRKAIVQYLKVKPFTSIAVEILFQGKEGVFIWGLLYNNKLKIKTPAEFLEIVIKAVGKYHNFTSLVNYLDQMVVGEKYFFTKQPELIRIGIVNHWFSVGPLDLWKRGQPKSFTRDNLVRKLKQRPELFQTYLNYQGLAFLFNLENKAPGLRYWIKTPCSRQKQGKWYLDVDLIMQFLTVWQGFKIN